jgi:hypothetical protein
MGPIASDKSRIIGKYMYIKPLIDSIGHSIYNGTIAVTIPSAPKANASIELIE